MSPEPTTTAIEPRVTLDDLRHRAEAVKTKAVTDAKDAVDTVFTTEVKRSLVVAAGVVLVAASVAYFLGTRAGRAALSRELPPEM
jgi:hypothetical protein